MDDLARVAQENYCRNWGAMYGSMRGVALGAGVIVRNLTYAIFSDAKKVFERKIGSALVLTHECDVDQSNIRDFNQHFIGVPLIFAHEMAKAYADAPENGKNLTRCAANGTMSRMYFLPPPPIAFPEMDHGAFVYLNLISSFHLSQLENLEGDQVCALSAYGLDFADKMLSEHLLRPKADDLARVGPAYRSVTITAART